MNPDPHDLYGLPLERFTDERNALAKRLRAEGRRDEAAEVSKLRKPSVAAWAVNQLVRTQGREIGVLFEVGDRLQKVQADLLEGRAEPGALRTALLEERSAVDRLTEKARGLLSSDGLALTAAKLEQVSDTLHAAAFDETARAEVRGGCLQRELRHVGLGALGATPAARSRAPAKAKAKAKAAPAPSPAKARAARLAAARKLETEARRRVERAAHDVAAAQERRDRLAESLDQAEDALGRARQAAELAEGEHRTARAALEDI